MSLIKLFFKGFVKGFRKFGHGLAMCINFVLLFLVYFTAVAVTSIVAKIIGKHFLNIEKGDKESYWSELDLGKGSLEHYYRQF